MDAQVAEALSSRPCRALIAWLWLSVAFDLSLEGLEPPRPIVTPATMLWAHEDLNLGPLLYQGMNGGCIPRA